MKRILLSAGLAMFLISSCDDKDKGGGGDSQAAKNKANYEKVVKAIVSGDSAVIREHIASDAVDHGGGTNGGEVKGDSIIWMLTNAHKGFTDFKMEIVADAADGDYVFGLVRMTGTTTATPVWGMPANTKIDDISVDVIKIKDGKMSDHWPYMDPKTMMKMMQNMPQPNMQPPVKDTVK